MWAILLVGLAVFCVVSGDDRLLPVCHKTQISDRLIEEGFIHIIYTMKSRCRHCYALATMLPELKYNIMLAEGIPVRIIIAVDRPAPLLSITLPENVKVDSSGDVFNKLGRKESHIFVLDKCRRLNYEVVHPWTLLIRPYVSATILATHFSNPCGHCYFGPATTPDDSQLTAESTTVPARASTSTNCQSLSSEKPEGSTEIAKSALELHKEELQKTVEGFEKFAQYLEDTNYLGLKIEKYDNSHESLDKAVDNTNNNKNGNIEQEKTELERLRAHYESLIPYIWQEESDNF